MNIEIKSRFTGDVIFSVEAGSIKLALQIASAQGADLWDANLWDANLWDADLRNADLRNADLRSADLRNANLWDANLRGANLRSANLRNADLRNADLRNAKLWDADLRNANLRGAKDAPVIIYGLYWDVIVGVEQMRIGCQKHSIDEWRAFTDEQIDDMDNKALEFWRAWKTPLLAISDANRREE